MIRMQQKQEFDKINILNGVDFLTGSREDFVNAFLKPGEGMEGSGRPRPLAPFFEEICQFLDAFSRELRTEPGEKAFPEIVTLAFWLRKASLEAMKKRFLPEEPGVLRRGRGLVFHIAPSNVPVNFAYSLAASFLSGNASIVRVPSKDFPQVDLIAKVLEKMLEAQPQWKPYLFLVRYPRSQEVNDLFSSLCDVRVIWGGDETIAQIRKSPLPPRSTEITFADRFSIAVIDAAYYHGMDENKKAQIANGFYNDTYLSDQNACTSPRIVFWIGTAEHCGEAKQEFWKRLHQLAAEKYPFHEVQAVDKLSRAYVAACEIEGAAIVPSEDNLLTRILLAKKPDAGLAEYMGNSGFFFEYETEDVLELASLADHEKCQTALVIGEPGIIRPLILSGIRGIDRVARCGHTMDFDLLWDGYNLVERMSRGIQFGG